MQKYNAAKDLYTAGKYEEAIPAFTELGDYSDSTAQITVCEEAIKKRPYNAAKDLYTAGKYEEAITAFTELGDYSDSAAQIIVCEDAIKERAYNAAKDLLAAGQYDEAYHSFIGMKGYKDVDSLLENDDRLKAVAAVARREPFTKVGNYVIYGHYEQDNDTSNGMEDIEWLVLDYDAANSRALLISRYGLDRRRYHEGVKWPTWEASSIRQWLNSDFLSAAFTADEQTGITAVTISTPSYNGNSGGADTQDQIWMLSLEEATTYFNMDKARQTTPTAYAVAHAPWQIDTGWCRWWLRSPGYGRSSASYVTSDGDFGSVDVNFTSIVRPAFWLDLSSL